MQKSPLVGKVDSFPDHFLLGVFTLIRRSPLKVGSALFVPPRRSGPIVISGGRESVEGVDEELGFVLSLINTSKK